MNEVTAVAKGDSSGQGYSFRGIDAVLTAVAPALRRHGEVVVPVVEGVEYATVEIGQRRTPMIQCRATVTYQWYGPAGDHVESRVVAEAMDSGVGRRQPVPAVAGGMTVYGEQLHFRNIGTCSASTAGGMRGRLPMTGGRSSPGWSRGACRGGLPTGTSTTTATSPGSGCSCGAAASTWVTGRRS